MNNINSKVVLVCVIAAIYFAMTQISIMMREKIPDLAGTLWYYSVSSGGHSKRSLGYRFIDDHAVEMLNDNASLGVVEYVIKDNKVFVKHACGTEQLISQGDDLVELPRSGGLPVAIHFKKVN